MIEGPPSIERLVVLDDDPTGVQTLEGIRVLLDWDPDRIARALAGRRSVHLITNSRALSPEQAAARVGAFSYRSARRLEWAEERSRGALRADAGREVQLDELRATGAAAVADALADLAASGRPCVLAVDAETDDDLALVAAGYAAAL